MNIILHVSLKSFDIYLSNYCHLQMAAHLFLLCNSSYGIIYAFVSSQLFEPGFIRPARCTMHTRSELISLLRQFVTKFIYSREWGDGGKCSLRHPALDCLCKLFTSGKMPLSTRVVSELAKPEC